MEPGGGEHSSLLESQRAFILRSRANFQHGVAEVSDTQSPPLRTPASDRGCLPASRIPTCLRHRSERHARKSSPSGPAKADDNRRLRYAAVFRDRGAVIRRTVRSLPHPAPTQTSQMNMAVAPLPPASCASTNAGTSAARRLRRWRGRRLPQGSRRRKRN